MLRDGKSKKRKKAFSRTNLEDKQEGRSMDAYISSPNDMNTTNIEKELKAYFKKLKDVEFAMLFGSTANGRTTPMSDIDVAVCFKNHRDNLKLAERQIEITAAIMKRCKINRVDVIVLNLANPFLAFQAIKNGRLLYMEDKKLFFIFKASALGRYQDIKPMYDLYDQKAKKRLKRG